MSTDVPQVVIVGAGITGLAAAFHLRQATQAGRLAARVTVVEADARSGGKIRTTLRDGCIVEQGPDSFTASKRDALELVHALGLDDQLVHSQAGPSYIFANGRLHPIPAGTRMGVPTRLLPLLQSSLISPAGKLRAALGLLRAPHPVDTDDSVGHFFRRRLGNNLVDRLIDPLLSAVYGGDIDHCSLQALFPQWNDPARPPAGPRAVAAPSPRASAAPGQAMRQGPFLTLGTGLESLVTRLEQRLPAGSVCNNARVRAIRRQPRGYALQLEDGRTLDADVVILALPSPAAAGLFQPALAAFQPLLRVPPASAAIVALAFRDSQVAIGRTGTGFLVPRDAGLTLAACTWTHLKWPHAVPRGTALLRCFLGRAGAEKFIDAPDAVVSANVLRELKQIVSIHGAPTFAQVARWKHAMPQYVVGHRDNVAAVRTALAARYPGVLLAGAAYDGVGLADCIRQGSAAAEAGLAHLARRAAA